MSAPNHYETLGVGIDVTEADLKSRYRALARRWHPDIARTADAAERFLAINEAYQVLIDPVSRAKYDAEQKLATFRAANSRPAGGAATSDTARPNRSRGTTTGSGSTRGADRTTRREADLEAMIDHLLQDAHIAVQRMNLARAIECCNAALRLDRRNAEAHEILGDIANARGQAEAALSHYTLAIQLDPRSIRVRAKFDRLVSEERGQVGYTASRKESSSSLALRQTATFMVCLGFFVALVAVVASSGASNGIEGAALWDWSAGLLFALPVSGAIAGVVCSYTAMVRPARSELMMTSSSRRSRSVVPMGVILVLLSLACFWMAGLLYTVMAITQEALSRSIVAAFVICAIIVLLFAVAVPAAPLGVLLLGGNMVFPAFIGGWALGDALR